MENRSPFLNEIGVITKMYEFGKKTNTNNAPKEF